MAQIALTLCDLANSPLSRLCLLKDDDLPLANVLLMNLALNGLEVAIEDSAFDGQKDYERLAMQATGDYAAAAETIRALQEFDSKSDSIGVLVRSHLRLEGHEPRVSYRGILPIFCGEIPIQVKNLNPEKMTGVIPNTNYVFLISAGSAQIELTLRAKSEQNNDLNRNFSKTIFGYKKSNTIYLIDYDRLKHTSFIDYPNRSGRPFPFP